MNCFLDHPDKNPRTDSIGPARDMCPSLNQSLVREMEYYDWPGQALGLLLTDNDVNFKGQISTL